MRTTRALAVSAVAVAAVGLAAPAASAWTDPSNIVAVPSVIVPGGKLTVTVDGTSCQNPRSSVSSPAFPTTPLSRTSGNTSSATPTVNRNAEPGAYDITVHCGEGRTLTRPNAFTVIRGGVRGGLGGSTTTGATRADMVIGGGLVAAAVVGGGVFWMRRRAESKA
ncbi:hypothetical protein EOT10_20080 [Streptomyces antnestii]|uniref:Integral membrane protein n=1 Tax=Streptomyces antnestii TaxID=2494256 RepID=A0A437PKQ6_9ACTN|nr:hypothetical protein [Streptomyces sp. San01]RVU22779.1 hypothetical protein EOT10_20080 [Streptomyces sp. San01]